jgi:hypothetical protein
MRTSWTIAIAVSLCAGASIAACGSAGTGNSGSNSGGSGASSGHGGSTGTGGHGGSMSSSTMGAGGGFILDSGLPETSAHDGDACGSVALTTHLTPGNIVVVFDQSDSMTDAYTLPDGGSGGAKWKVAEEALTAALTPNEALVNAGAIFFPTTATGNTCSTVALIGAAPQIQIEPGAKFVTDFEGHFSATGWTVILGTPTKDALTNANLALPDPSPFPGQRAVIILTDGAPTCDTVKADILAPVQAMFTRGIKTYAVGLPGSTGAANLLNAIAQAGGTGTYVSPSDPTSLQTALSQIASTTVDQCTVTLTPPPEDPSLVYLIVTDATHPQGYEIPRGDGGDGWTLSSDGTTATLVGSVCSTAKSGGYTSLQFVYGCAVLP